MFYRQHKRIHPILTEEQITKQSHLQECDINFILSQHQRTGVINHVNPTAGEYMELPDTYDYQSSLNTIMQAENAFAELPAKVRDHFGNDPASYLDAFNDDARRSELEALGVVLPSQKDQVTSPGLSPDPSPPSPT